MGKLATTPQKAQADQGLPAVGTQTYLREIYIKEVYGREKDITAKYMEKGLLCEEDALGLLGKFDGGKLYIKNKDKFENDFIKGTPDNVQGKVRDTKTSWGIYSFFNSKMTKDYEWQLRAYMALTGLAEGELDYCLVNTPDHLVFDEQQRLKWKMGVIDADNDQDYIEACREIEKFHNFDDIPIEKKVRKFFLKRDEEKEEWLYQRIKESREYLKNLKL